MSSSSKCKAGEPPGNPSAANPRTFLPVNCIPADSTPVNLTTSASHTLDVSTATIPPELNQLNPWKWKRGDVKKYLEANKEEYDLEDEDITRLYEERVSGLVLLLLTKNELTTFYGLHLGTAGTIELLINALTQPQAVVKGTGESASQSGISTKSLDELHRLWELEESLERQVFQIIVKPNRSTSTPWLVNINTVTLADLVTFITHHHDRVKDTDRFIFEKNGVKIAEPLTDAELRDFLQAITATKDTTLIVDPKSDVKVFSDF